MSENIRKEPVSPLLRVEPPSAPPDNRRVHSGEKPRFPGAMAFAGAIWTLAGILLLMLIPPLLYKAWPLFNYVLHGLAFPEVLGLLFLFLVLSIVAALSGAAFIRAGARIRRSTAQGGPLRRLAVYSLFLALLLSFLSLHTVPLAVIVLTWMASPPAPGETRYWSNALPDAAFGVLSVPAILLLLTAGVLALRSATEELRMSLASEPDGGRRPPSLGWLLGLISLILGAVVAIGCAELAFEAFKWWRTPAHYIYSEHGTSYVNDPLSYILATQSPALLSVGAGALLGCVLACIALRRPPRRWGVTGLALNAGCPLLCYACYLVLNSFLQPPLPPPIPRLPPTAFFEWCRSNNFGVKSPAVSSKSETNADQGSSLMPGEIGSAEFYVKTPCKNGDEARKFLDTAVAELQGVAKEKGIVLSATKGNSLSAKAMWEPSVTNPGEPISGISLMYRSGPIFGFFDVKSIPYYTMADGKPDYYRAEFRLTEYYSKPE